MDNYSVQNAFRIAELIQLNKDHRLSEAESAEFQNWLMAGEGNRALAAEWDDETSVDEFIDIYLSATDSETAFEAHIAAHLQTDEHKEIHRGYWMTAVAAVLLTATLVATLWYFKEVPGKTVPLTAGTPINIPGRVIPSSGTGVMSGLNTRAYLTVADGSTLTLDSVPRGFVTRQGSVQVVKTESGTLAYEGGQTEQSDVPSFNTVTTPKGGTYKVTLPDGTVCRLNAASSLRFPVPFSGNQRKVTLSGEAYFEVVDNPSSPFMVDINHSHTEIQVLGTHFNVLAYEDETISKTTVLEGSVKVTAGSLASGTLQMNQQAEVNKEGGLRVVDAGNAKDAIAWTNDQLALNRDIKDIMRDISRWYDVSVSYQGNQEGHSFAGTIPMDSSLTFVLKALEATGTIHFTIADKRRIIVTP